MTETSLIRMILDVYGAMIEDAASRYRHRPAVLAGIMMRETEGGTSKYLDQPGPGGRGDRGHGHGLMQIDDRSFSVFCAGPDWYDAAKNINFGACVLGRKRAFLARNLLGHAVSDDILERAAIAAYNCGEGRALKSLLEHEDVDTHTTRGNYAREVLRFADIYEELEDNHDSLSNTGSVSG